MCNIVLKQEEGVCKEEDMNGKISGWHTYLQQQFETSKEAVIEVRKMYYSLIG